MASSKRLSSEQSRALLIQSATELLRQRSPAEVSVREIAARAGVNHGLVHRHFGGKDGLVSAVLERIFRQTGRAIVDSMDQDPAEAVYQGLRVLMAERWIAAVVAHLLARGCPEGIPEASMMPVFGQRMKDPDREMRMVVAVGEAATLGWMLFEPLVARGTGLEDMEPEARLRLFANTLAANLAPLLDAAPRTM